MKLLREYIRELLRENHDWTSDETLPPIFRNLPQHVKDTVPIDIRKQYVKGYPELGPGERIKTDSIWEGIIGASPTQIPAGTLLTVVRKEGRGKYSFKVDQPTIAKSGMKFERETKISPNEELIFSGYQLWKHTPARGMR